MVIDGDKFRFELKPLYDDKPYLERDHSTTSRVTWVTKMTSNMHNPGSLIKLMTILSLAVSLVALCLALYVFIRLDYLQTDESNDIYKLQEQINELREALRQKQPSSSSFIGSQTLCNCPAGQKGAMGEKGTKGERGYTGQTGATTHGEKGEKGAKGEIGGRGQYQNADDSSSPQTHIYVENGGCYSCPRGKQGPKGEKGDTGQKGNFGTNGPQGPAGEKGSIGERGPRGEKGERSSEECNPYKCVVRREDVPYLNLTQLKGEKGNPGRKGIKGTKGLAGLYGSPGDKGSQGERGEKGKTGLKGEAGEKGQKGEIGKTGPRGFPGAQGKEGEKGARGLKGERGEKGIPGLDAPCAPDENGIPRKGCYIRR